MSIATLYRDAYRDGLRDAVSLLGDMASHEENEDAMNALIRAAESLLRFSETVTDTEEKSTR